MEIITFANILDKVVNNRTISRKEKLIAIQRFLKENSGKGKQTLPEEITIIETLKTLRKTFLLKDKVEKQERVNVN